MHADMSKVMVLGGEEGLLCEINMVGRQLEQFHSKYLGFMLHKSGID